MEADHWVYRRRLRRSLAWWRALAICAMVAAVVIAIGQVDDVVSREYVARLSVSGLIVDDPDRDRALVDIAEDARAQAVIVRIDSPGGTLVGGETLFRLLRDVASRKPVVAVMGELAT